MILNSSVSKYQSLIVQVRKIIASWTVSIVYLKCFQTVPLSNSEEVCFSAMGICYSAVNKQLKSKSWASHLPQTQFMELHNRAYSTSHRTLGSLIYAATSPSDEAAGQWVIPQLPKQPWQHWWNGFWGQRGLESHWTLPVRKCAKHCSAAMGTERDGQQERRDGSWKTPQIVLSILCFFSSEQLEGN